MPAIADREITVAPPAAKAATICYHCGAKCNTQSISIKEKYFCCDGCKLVYELLNENNLCDYYNLQSHPGLSQIKPVRSDKYLFLDTESIASKFYQFSNRDLTIVTLYIPGIHCSSCMWLLEHLNRINPGITESRINFSAKEITIHFTPEKISFREVVELLSTIGYEPYISLSDTSEKAPAFSNKSRTIKLGIAGFCFGNIMMLSFPEYLSGKIALEEQYTHLFRYLNLVLALPVFFYSATEFYAAAWAGIKQRMLNIDMPIVLALIITFIRSVYEIATNSGAGYLDSMSGIVFFMLVGRIVQERTYKSLSFTRDYKAYFPVAVRVKTENEIVTKQLQDIVKGDIVILRHEEIIPADAVVLTDNAMIDYSFVTGEADPVRVRKNETVYAGGKQNGNELIIQVVKPVAGSYLTSLWNHFAFRKYIADVNDKQSIIHVLSRHFTAILFALALLTATYWFFHDSSKIVTSVSAMLIVACPCALLLAATFTNSNILRILSLNGLYLRDASVIEQMATANHIVFDKTGTITDTQTGEITFRGPVLNEHEQEMLYGVVSQSNHPNSKALASWLGKQNVPVPDRWEELPGKGIQAAYGQFNIMVGSALFVGTAETADGKDKAAFYVRINDKVTGCHMQPHFRTALPSVIPGLRRNYDLSILSGDNDRQRPALEQLFGGSSDLLFEQKPIDKLRHIEQLQNGGEHIIMIGDGLNDAGALQQSNVGITLTEDVNNFTPACDAIFNAANLHQLPSLLQLAKHSDTIIKSSFAVSILYNLGGLYFAMQGQMQPVVAAILMPCSTLSIVIISSGASNILAWKKGLKISSSSN